MKIGKTIRTVTSPKREVRKAQKKEQPIPVEMPERIKVPEKAETEFRFIYGCGRAYGKVSGCAFLTSVTS